MFSTSLERKWLSNTFTPERGEKPGQQARVNVFRKSSEVLHFRVQKEFPKGVSLESTDFLRKL